MNNNGIYFGSRFLIRGGDGGDWMAIRNKKKESDHKEHSLFFIIVYDVYSTSL